MPQVVADRNAVATRNGHAEARRASAGPSGLAITAGNAALGRWLSILFGLVIGCAGAGAVWVWLVPAAPSLATAPPVPPRPIVQAGAGMAPARQPAAQPWAPPASVHSAVAPATAVVPRVVYPNGHGGASDPHVVPVAMPHVPGPAPAHGQVVAGTGFFIAEDGLLLTASHVVQDCQHIRLISPVLPMVDATRLADDPAMDVALLGAHLRAPAVLPLARGRSTTSKVFILGYPATASLRQPEETWAVLENNRLPAALGWLSDVRQTVWVRSPAVTHGYSGGPILDLRDGSVTGLVKAGILGGNPFVIQALSGGGVSYGPGVAQLAAFLHKAAPGLALTSVRNVSASPLETARRATVHVLCWR